MIIFSPMPPLRIWRTRFSFSLDRKSWSDHPGPKANRGESFEKELQQRVDELQEELVRTQKESARKASDLQRQIDAAAKRNDDLRAQLLAILREVSDLKAGSTTFDFALETVIDQTLKEMKADFERSSCDGRILERPGLNEILDGEAWTPPDKWLRLRSMRLTYIRACISRAMNHRGADAQRLEQRVTSIWVPKS